MASMPLRAFPSFEPHSDSSSIALRWTKWLARFEIFLEAMNVTDDSRKRAMLLHFSGEEVYDIFSTFSGTGTTFSEAATKLTNYFAPKKNIEYEVYLFRQAHQLSTESLDDFHTRLRKLSTFCDFSAVDKELKSQIIQGTTLHRLRTSALRDPTLTLEAMLDMGRLYESSELQASHMEKNDSNDGDRKPKVNEIRRSTPRNLNARNKKAIDSEGKQKQDSKPKSHSEQKNCYKCGFDWPHNSKCPAQGKICSSCKKKDHFARCCKSTRPKATRQLQQIKVEGTACSNEDSEGAHLFSVATQNHVSPQTKVQVNGQGLNMTIDSGATVNVISSETYYKLKLPALTTTNIRLKAYGSDQLLPVMGRCKVWLAKRNRKVETHLYVVGCKSNPLLGCKTAQELDVLRIVEQVDAQQLQGNSNTEWKVKYPRLFEGVGKLKDYKAHLHIDKSVPGRIAPHRRIPFAVRKQVEKELEKLEKADIIEKVTGPSPWVSPIVVAPKPKEPEAIRVCVDMREANKAIKRERHVTPTADDILAAVNGTVMFSKIDLNMGYHQIELDEESRVVTTFTTHVGLRRYKRLFFGISSAAELFQDIIAEVISGIPGVLNASDDILVHGKSIEDHDRSLHLLLQRLEESGLTVNEKKCLFKQTSLLFYGFLLTNMGVSADPAKIKVFTGLQAPSTVEEVHSLLGMIQYCGRFIPDLASITFPLRQLLKKGSKMEWAETHQEAFDTLKNLLAEDRQLAYFNPELQINLVVDASPYGLGAILSQTNGNHQVKVVAYASKALTDVEQRYSQIERELLAVAWGMDHFHLFLYGTRFTVYTDHQPLISILNKPHLRTSARIERLCIRTQQHNFDVVYQKGKDNPSDYLSRHPISPTEVDDLEESINFVVKQATPNALTAEEIVEATLRDATLSKLRNALNEHSEKPWNSELLRQFKPIRFELSVHKSGIILRGSRIVVPEALQSRCLELAHIGHQGIVKTKALLREKILFPGIDVAVETLVKNCLACQATVKGAQTVPLEMTPMPKEIWQHLTLDFAGPFPDGKYLMVLIDEYSRYPVVHVINSLMCGGVIGKLETTFALFGFPERLKTDNGPPFNSSIFTSRLKDLGCYHHKVTKLWPQANGEVERFMRTLNKFVQIANLQDNSWNKELRLFLISYRSTPHTTTGKSPSELIFGRPMKTWFPNIETLTDNENHGVRERDCEQKKKMKDYADEKRNSKPHSLQIGDWVLVHQSKRNKLTSYYDPKPYRVADIRGSWIKASRGTQTIERNCSFFKNVSPEAAHQWVWKDDDDEYPAVRHTGPQEASHRPGANLPREVPPEEVMRDRPDPAQVPREGRQLPERVPREGRQLPERVTRGRLPKRYEGFEMDRRV